MGGLLTSTFQPGYLEQHDAYKPDKPKERGLGELLPDLINRTWITSAVTRSVGRSIENGPSVEGYSPLAEPDIEEMRVKYSKKEMEFLTEAGSPQAYQAKKRQIKEDSDAWRRLGEGGLKTQAALVAFNVADPIAWISGAGITKIGVASKLSRVNNMLVTGAAVGVENGLFELAQIKSDSSREASDALWAVGAGAFLGGGISGIFGKGTKHGDSLTKRSYQDTNDYLHNSDVKQKVDNWLQESDHLKKLPPRLSETDRSSLSKRARNKNKTKQSRRLARQELQVDDMWYTAHHGESRTQLEIKAKELIEAGKKYYDERLSTAAIKSVKKARRGVLKRINRTSTFDELAPLERQLDEFDEVIRVHGLSDEAKDIKRAQLEKFEKMPFDEQIKKLAPSSSRLRVDLDALIKKQTKAVDAVTEKSKKEIKSKWETIKKSAKADKDTPDLDVEIQILDEVPADAKAPRELAIKAKEEESFTIQSEDLDTRLGRKEIEEEVAMSEKLKDQIDETNESPVTVQFTLLPKVISDTKFMQKHFPDGLVGRHGKRLLSSSFTFIDGSKNMANRALNFLFNESPQGNFLARDTAGIWSDLNLNYIKSAARNRPQEAFENYRKAKSINVLNAYAYDGLFKADFNHQVFLAIKNPGMEGVDPFVREAADGYNDVFSLGLKLQQEAGVRGWEKIKDTKDYAPDIFSGSKMDQYVVKYPKQIEDLLSDGYQTGALELRKEVADSLAKLQIAKVRDADITLRTMTERVMNPAQEKVFLEELSKAGVDDEVLEAFMLQKEVRKLSGDISNRAKRSMKINVMASTTLPDGARISVADLMETNMTSLSDMYAREAAGNSGLAMVGIKSYGEAKRMIQLAANQGLDSGVGRQIVKEEKLMLDRSLDLVFHKNIEADPSGMTARNMRRVREYAANARLGQVGLAQLSETARGMSELGVDEMLKGMQGVNFFMRKSARKGNVHSGELNEPMLRELEYQFGYIGENNLLNEIATRTDDVGTDLGGSKVGKIFDNTMASAGRLNTVMSGFQAIQGNAEKVVAKGIAFRVLDMAKSGKKMPQDAMDEIGWSREYTDDLLDFIRKNPKSEQFDGRTVELIDFQNMTTEMRNTYRIGSWRKAGRIIQSNKPGDTSHWVHSTTGKALSQFRNFQLVSLEKQLIHDLRGDRTAAAQTLLWSAFLGYMAYGAGVGIRAIGEKDSAGYFREKMNLSNTISGVAAKMPQPASLQLGGDFLATVGLIPSDTMSGRYGFRQLDANSVPAVGLGNDVFSILRGTSRMVRGDATSKEAFKTIDKFRKTVVLGNTLATAPLLNGLTKLARD